MASYEGYLADLEVAPTRTVFDTLRTHTSVEFETFNVDPIYVTVPCEAALCDLLSVSFTLFAVVRSLTGAEPLEVYGCSITHYKMDYLNSWEGVNMLVLYGLPASEFGFVRAITITHKGCPVPFLTTVLDAALPTGLITSAVGKSSTVVQKLKYIVRGRRPHEEYESDELDLSGAIPPEIEITIRRKRSNKMNRRKIS